MSIRHCADRNITEYVLCFLEFQAHFDKSDHANVMESNEARNCAGSLLLLDEDIQRFGFSRPYGKTSVLAHHNQLITHDRP